MIVNVEMRGTDALMAKMQAMLEAAKTGVAPSFAEGAERIAEAARRNAPTAGIAQSIEVVSDKNGAKVICTDPLGILFEYGTDERVQETTGRETGFMRAQPFYRPAVDEEEARAVAAIAETLGQHIEGAVGG